MSHRIRVRPLPLVAALLAGAVPLASPAFAQERGEAGSPGVKEDWFQPEADALSLKTVLEEGHVSNRWIYHDLDEARRRAERTGQPILAVFRCVPCGSAPGLDGAVCTAGGAEASEFEDEIRRAGGDLPKLLDQFVAVRMVKMNGVNRNVFRFDRDVPYVAMFLNSEGEVYGRYGTRSSPERKNLPRHRLTSFQQSLRRVLELHENRAALAEALAAKRVPAGEPAFAEAMATFEAFPAEHNPKVANCIHCHTVGEAEVRHALVEQALELRDVWPFPPAENLGLRLDPEDGLVVESVAPDSPAARAGVLSGDVLERLANQPLVSEADVQWALHHAPDEGTLPLALRRGERTVDAEIALAGDWRRNDGSWRASISPLRADVHLRTDPSRARKGAEPGRMGLEVRYPRGPAAQAGLRNGDLLVAVDGRTDLHLEGDLLEYVHLEKPDAASIELTIVRDGQRSRITLPLR